MTDRIAADKDAVRGLLDSLRWKEDDLVKNPFGETVYLKKHDSGGGLTDCCFADEPCDRHQTCVHD